MLLLPLFVIACRVPPCDSSGEAYVPPHEAWDAATEDEPRLAQGDLVWVASGGATVDPAATGCDTSPCVGVSAPGEAVATAVLNRSSPYRLAATVTNDQGVTVSWTQTTSTNEEVTLFTETLSPGVSVPLTETFELTEAGATTTLHVRPIHTATLDGLTLTGTRWVDVGIAPPAAPLRLAFLIHVEENNAFSADETEWRRKATVLEGLSRTLHAHGAGLTIQADNTFIEGAAVWDPTWVDERLAEGASFSAHLHYTTGGDDVFREQIQGARRALSTAGVTVRDLNGGFTLGAWGVAADEGYVSLTALKDPETQGGLPHNYTSPWRPADGSTTDDLDGFSAHDPAGPLVYLPGMEGREADHARWPDWAGRVLGQVLAHTDADAVNNWYFLSHVDAFGPPDDAGVDAYLSDGSFEADLVPYDTFFGEVVDPLVAAGSVVYSTPDAITADYLDAEAGGCK